MKKLLAIATCLMLLSSAALAQTKTKTPTPAPRVVATPPCTAPCTQQQLLNDVQTQFADNTSGAITPAVLRTFFANAINSMMATSPLVGGEPTCYAGTTGLPSACPAPLALGRGGTAAISQGNAAINIFPTPTRAGDVTYWNGANWVTLAGNNSGTKVLQQDSAGTPSWASISGFPAPTAVGDLIYWGGSAWLAYAGNSGAARLLMESSSGAPSWVSGAAAAAIVLPSATVPGSLVYWNGAAWATFAGNTAGTKYLTQDSVGVPSWTAAAASVTSVVCGTGLSGGTITATGTCAVNLTALTSSLIADVAFGDNTNYFTGPQVVQGTTGSWWAAGTVTIADTGSGSIYCKLWDGTTVIASTGVYMDSSTTSATLTMSGLITAPAGNISIACKDANAPTGTIKFNLTGNSKDSTVSVMRVQ
jgi:hypothetical protein